MAADQFNCWKNHTLIVVIVTLTYGVLYVVIFLLQNVIGICTQNTHEGLVRVLLIGDSGEEGEMYLGYKNDREAVLSYLRQLVARLHDKGI